MTQALKDEPATVVRHKVPCTTLAPLNPKVQHGGTVAHFEVDVAPLQELSLGPWAHACGSHKGHIKLKHLANGLRASGAAVGNKGREVGHDLLELSVAEFGATIAHGARVF